MTSHLVFLHIGAPKTGTSYLQTLLYDNRRHLQSYGVLRPGAHAYDHFRAMLDLRGKAWKGSRNPLVPGSWDRLATQSRRWHGTVVISQEVLASSTEEQARRAVESLRPAEVHIIYTVRDYGRVIASAWQQNVRTGGRRGYRKYVDSLQRDGSHARGFWGNHDLPAVLGRWGADLPPSHVHVVTVPREASAPAVLWQRFAAVIRLDPTVISSDYQPQNVSVGAAEARLLADINRRLDGRLPFTLYGPLVSNRIATKILTMREGRLPYGLPPEAYQWVHARAEQHIRATESAGYDVVGKPGRHVAFAGSSVRGTRPHLG